MGWFASFAGYLAPGFLILSPLLSYTDQVYSMHRNRSSAGFSLDIPLIMLVASLLRIFYYPGAQYDKALLVQSFVMVFIQVILLKVALDHRPPPSSKGGDAATPFAGAAAKDGTWEVARPFHFWQWKSPRPYWRFLLWLFIFLTACELLLAPSPFLYPVYSATVGYIGLSVEATLPLPQILANARTRSSRGFRVSVLASWLLGDGMKIFWFFTATSAIPWAFKLCGIFQAGCDCFLGLQYLMYGDYGGAPTLGDKIWGPSSGWRKANSPGRPEGVSAGAASRLKLSTDVGLRRFHEKQSPLPTDEPVDAVVTKHGRQTPTGWRPAVAVGAMKKI